jgi:hypothetical protein
MAISPFSSSYREPTQPSQFVQFEFDKLTRIRILDEGIAGFEAWTQADNKPVRLPMNEQGKPEGQFSVPVKKKWRKDANGKEVETTEDKISVFWAFTVWNYDLNQIQVWSFTQAGIKKAITNYRQDPDYADMLSYDLKMTKRKTGEKKTDVEYAVLAGKETDLPAEATEAMSTIDIDLDRLFTGEYPIKNS